MVALTLLTTEVAAETAVVVVEKAPALDDGIEATGSTAPPEANWNGTDMKWIFRPLDNLHYRHGILLRSVVHRTNY